MKISGILVCIGLLVMCGCGSGGGESATLGSVFKTTKAVITVSIPTLPAGKLVNLVSFNVKLPAGVTPAVLNANNASGSISLIGGATGSLGAAGFDSATNTITIGSVTLNAFGSGDFLVINCLLGSNTTATASDFTLFDGSVFDIGGISLGVTPTISVVFR